MNIMSDNFGGTYNQILRREAAGNNGSGVDARSRGRSIYGGNAEDNKAGLEFLQDSEAQSIRRSAEIGALASTNFTGVGLNSYQSAETLQKTFAKPLQGQLQSETGELSDLGRKLASTAPYLKPRGVDLQFETPFNRNDGYFEFGDTPNAVWGKSGNIYDKLEQQYGF